VGLAALRPRLGIRVGRLPNAAKAVAFCPHPSLKLQHSSGNLVSTSDSNDDYGLKRMES
jgi:hypothetical protein